MGRGGTRGFGRGLDVECVACSVMLFLKGKAYFTWNIMLTCEANSACGMCSPGNYNSSAAAKFPSNYMIFGNFVRFWLGSLLAVVYIFVRMRGRAHARLFVLCFSGVFLWFLVLFLFSKGFGRFNDANDAGRSTLVPSSVLCRRHVLWAMTREQRRELYDFSFRFCTVSAAEVAEAWSRYVDSLLLFAAKTYRGVFPWVASSSGRVCFLKVRPNSWVT